MIYSVTDPLTEKTYDYGPHRKADAEKLAYRLGVEVVERKSAPKKKPKKTDDGFDAMRDDALLRGTWKHRSRR